MHPAGRLPCFKHIIPVCKNVMTEKKKEMFPLWLSGDKKVNHLPSRVTLKPMQFPAFTKQHSGSRRWVKVRVRVRSLQRSGVRQRR